MDLFDINNCDDIVVLDFETSGMSPQQGDRAIEVGAVRLRNQVIVDQFQSLMNPGFTVNSFIEDFTGITNGMLAQAPPAKQVMTDFADFIGNSSLVAHNASFDRRFLEAELSLINVKRPLVFGCSMLVARRIYPQAPNHKLATLVDYKGLPCNGTFHRALADAEMTAHLWLQMGRDLSESYQIELPSFDLLSSLGQVPVKKVSSHLKKVLNL